MNIYVLLEGVWNAAVSGISDTLFPYGLGIETILILYILRATITKRNSQSI